MRSLVRRLGLAVLTAGLTAGLVAFPTATPGHATSADGSGVVHPEWGSVTGESGVLRRGCKKYHYSYDITPPQGDWALEVFISGPRLEHLAAGAYMGGYDPEKNIGTYKVCKATTRPGRFTIEGRLSVQDGPGSYVEGWLPPDHFRLRRPGRS